MTQIIDKTNISKINKNVNLIFEDMKEMDVLNSLELFPGKIPETKDIVRGVIFNKKLKNNSGTFMSFIGECSIYNAIWINDQENEFFKKKIFIPDEKELEIEELCKKHFNEEKNINKYGIKKRIIANVICFESPEEKEKFEMIKLLDLDLSFFIFNIKKSNHFNSIKEGNSSIEYWREEKNVSDLEYSFSLPKIKIWPEYTIDSERKNKIKNKIFNLDSFVRKNFYESLEDWNSNLKEIEKHFEKIKEKQKNE